MSNEKHKDPKECNCSRLLAEIRAQCERLLHVVQEMEKEKERDSERLAAIREELTDYQTFVYNWAGQQVREEDWEGFAEEDYTIVPEDVIAELERQE